MIMCSYYFPVIFLLVIVTREVWSKSRILYVCINVFYPWSGTAVTQAADDAYVQSISH